MPDDIVTIEPIFRDTTIIYNLDFTDVLAGTLPPGWIVTQENNTIHSYPNSYSSGSRVMSGFPGMYPKAIYWRFNDCQYGTQENYPLTLKAGKYRLIYTMAAWNGTSNYKAQILNGSTVIATGQTYASAPDAKESTGTDLSSSTIYTLEFEVTTPGKYIIKFAGVRPVHARHSGGTAIYHLPSFRPVFGISTPAIIRKRGERPIKSCSSTFAFPSIFDCPKQR